MSVLKRDYESYLKSLQAWRDQAQAYSDSVGGDNPQLWQYNAGGAASLPSWSQMQQGANGWTLSGNTVYSKPGQWLEQVPSESGSYYQVRSNPASVAEQLVAQKNEGGAWVGVDRTAVSGPSIGGIGIKSPLGETGYERDQNAAYREDGNNLYLLTPTYPSRPESDTPPAAPSLTLQQQAQLNQPDPDVAFTQGMINQDKQGTVAQRFAGFGADDSSEGMVARAIKEKR